MYQLTEDSNIVVRLTDHVLIRRGQPGWYEYVLWCDEGNVARRNPDLTLMEKVNFTDRLIEAWLDGVVQKRNYKSIESCVSYVDDDDPAFDAEARSAKSWRSAVYAKAREIMSNPPEDLTPIGVFALLPQPSEFGWSD